MKYAKIKKGRVRCQICGTKFPAIAEKRYTSRAASSLSSIVNNSYYDTFDCPQCGCQNRVGERKDGVPNEEGGPNE